MEIFSMQFLWALGAIILIDLVLAGDNAIVIALAARNLPKHLQKKAIVWGTAGAIAVRSAMTVVVVWLLKIPGLLLLGGALLVWIAIKLLKPADGGDGDGHQGATSFWGAMKTIVIADAVMGLDNVLAVAGAAHGSFLLVVLGLLISIPIVVWGSTLILKWVERFPVIMYAGAGVLAWTAVKMMLGEPLVKEFVEPFRAHAWVAYVLVVGGVIGIGYILNRNAERSKAMSSLAINDASVAASTARATTGEAAPAAAGGILLPVNGRPESRAAAKHLAGTLSGVAGAHVHLLHVTPFMHKHITRFLSSEAKRKFREDRAAAAVEPERRLLEMAGVSTSVHTMTALDIAGAIVETALREKCARIVMGATRKSPLVRMATNSVTGRVLAESRVPVEIVSGREASVWQRVGVPAGIGLAMAALLIELD
ncbi:MAG: YjbE family putative metal transport protein [Burkholderiales bacterium]|nr:YjbE family putative metal transport protein [Burkholderiales bacterium]